MIADLIILARHSGPASDFEVFVSVLVVLGMGIALLLKWLIEQASHYDHPNQYRHSLPLKPSVPQPPQPRSIPQERNTSVVRNGISFCPRCNRQVSVRRDQCRSCNHIYRTTFFVMVDPDPWEISAYETAMAAHEARIKAEEDAKIAVRERRDRAARERAEARAERALRREAFYCSRGIEPTRLAFVHLLPDWLQPMLWGLMVGVTAVFFGLAALIPTNAIGWMALLAFGCFSLAATSCVVRESLRRPARTLDDSQEEFLDVSKKADRVQDSVSSRAPEFARRIAAHLKATHPRDFDLPMFARYVGLEPASDVRAACGILYSRFARTIVADGVVTPAERRRIDQLASLLRLTPDEAAEIEENARRARYEEALREVYEDGVVTAEEADMLADLRASLGLADAEVVEADEPTRS